MYAQGHIQTSDMAYPGLHHGCQGAQLLLLLMRYAACI